MGCERVDLEHFYRRYLHRCNEYRFDDLGEFVDENVEVNGEILGLRLYGAGLRSVIELIPDFHWDLRHLVVDDAWLAAHLFDTGTARDGQAVGFQEFAIYRLDDGHIVEVWGDLDRARLPV